MREETTLTQFQPFLASLVTELVTEVKLNYFPNLSNALTSCRKFWHNRGLVTSASNSEFNRPGFSYRLSDGTDPIVIELRGALVRAHASGLREWLSNLNQRQFKRAVLDLEGVGVFDGHIVYWFAHLRQLMRRKQAEVSFRNVSIELRRFLLDQGLVSPMEMSGPQNQ